MGTTATFVAIVCGQSVAAVLIDRRGWLGVDPIPLSPGRILGVRFLLAGVRLVQQG